MKFKFIREGLDKPVTVKVPCNEGFLMFDGLTNGSVIDVGDVVSMDYLKKRRDIDKGSKKHWEITKTGTTLKPRMHKPNRPEKLFV